MFFPIAIFFLIMSLFFRVMSSINQRRLHQNRPLEWRQLLPGSQKINKTSSTEEFEVYIYRLAAKKKGRLTSAQIVVDSGLPLSEVDRRMATLVDSVHICMEVKDSGLIVYEFPELFS